MSILPITLYGDTILRKKAKPVTLIDEKIKKLVAAMFETMYNANGMGLAANQVGSDKSVFIVDLSHLEEYSKTKPIVVINPKIVEASDETAVLEEGCLSIPDLRAKVERPKGIVLEFQDLDMKKVRIEDDAWFSRVFQHEFDHLQGIYFTDRCSPEDQKRLKKSLNKIKDRKIEFEYPVTPKE